MRKTEFLAMGCDPKTLTVGQLMQDAVFTCGSRTDALTEVAPFDWTECSVP